MLLQVERTRRERDGKVGEESSRGRFRIGAIEELRFECGVGEGNGIDSSRMLEKMGKGFIIGGSGEDVFVMLQ